VHTKVLGRADQNVATAAPEAPLVVKRAVMPTYASFCSGFGGLNADQRYASACSCWGFLPSVTVIVPVASVSFFFFITCFLTFIS
jgi:hypothetical protein